MKHIKKNATLPCNSLLSDTLFHENSIFFDIETTGFSPMSSICYLIGTLRKDADEILIDQFLASDTTDEKDVILSFLELLNDKTTIITFNGMGFDMPYIQAKCKTYAIDFDFSLFQYVDLFKLVSDVKFLLKLQNYKQKTIEQFLGIYRDDLYSGGQLISVYEEYTRSHSKESEALLLLHNYEDVMGMLDILPVLNYRELFQGGYILDNVVCLPFTSYEGDSGKELIITLNHKFPVPKRVSHRFGDFYISMMANTTKIRVSVYEGTLHYFYPNYKDYFYLPKEDIAIHKSVASFVDKDFREKAKANNCYTKRNGQFLPQFEEIMTPAFRKHYKDKCSYFELTEEFIASEELMYDYVQHILKYMKRYS